MMAGQTHTHWKKLNNPDYLGAYAFDPGQEITATIDYVKQELVTGAEGKKEQCIVAHFRENLKPLILNATNCKTITNLFRTPYIEEWGGKKISMHVEQVRAFGDLVDAVRVMKKISTKGSAALKCDACGKAIAGMGSFTPEQIAANTKQKYGKCLCVECGQKAKAEMEAKEAEAQKAAEKEAEEKTDDIAAQLMAEAEE